MKSNSTTPPGDSIDRRTVAYVLSVQEHFDHLRQTAGQLAGLLVLAASGARSITPDHDVLAAAAASHRFVAVHLPRVNVPERAREQHSYLLQALDLIGTALRACQRDIAKYARSNASVTDALRPLQAGYAHLQRAATLLPGFEVIDFAQGCCASHPAVLDRQPHSYDHNRAEHLKGNNR